MNLHPSACTRRPHFARQRGVTLVELMVGLVIGLLATLVIAQVAIVFEGQKRSTTGGSDAQLNGALALQTLQRDVQMSGYGITSFGGAGCTLNAQIGGSTSLVTPSVIAPVIITDSPSGMPDSIRILSSTQLNSALPIPIASDHVPTNSYFTLPKDTNIGNAQGDLMLAISDSKITPPTCTLFSINVDGMRPLNADGSEASTPLGTIPLGSPLYGKAVAGMPSNAVVVGSRIGHTSNTTASGLWNGDGANPLITTTYAKINTHLINLGQQKQFIDRIYSINSEALSLSEFNGETGIRNPDEALFANIISLQAVYGKAIGNTSQIADTWNASDPSSDVIPGVVNPWTRVVAVRIALVARSAQYEKEPVTTVEPTWMPDGVNTEILKVDHLNNWQHYRYKVFEVAVPLRNMLWQS